MANPQQPELARSRRTPALDPDATEAVLTAEGTPTADRSRGPVPVDNQPGHHPPVEQDKPDADRFMAKVKAVAAEAEAEAEADDGAAAVEVGPSVEATTAARSQGAAPVPPVPAPHSPAQFPPASPRADGLAALAGAPWKLASGVLQRLRDRL